MKTDKLLYFLTFSLTILGCYHKSTDSNKRDVVLTQYRHNKFHHKDTIELSSIIKADTIFGYYLVNHDTLIAHSFKISSKNDSFLFVFGLNCPLVAKKQFVVDGKPFMINKYYYDVPHVIDEEASFFYNEHYGLLVGLNDSWSTLGFTMQYDKISRILVDSILNNRTGFYERILAPVPPPPEGVNEVIELIDLNKR